MRSLFRAPALAMLLAAALLGCTGERGGQPAPRRIFLITVDTLRADHTSLYGYARRTTPRLDALAPAGVLFEDAVAQWPKTGASFASMFTGRYPQTTGMMQKAALRIPPSYLTLPELLQDEGYRTAAVVSNAVLGAPLGWNRGFDEYLQTWGEGGFPKDPHAFRELAHAPRVNALARGMLDRFAQGDGKDEKLFVWVHYTDPHAPYVLPPGVDNPFLGDAQSTGDERAPRHVEPQVPRHVARTNRLGEQRDRRFYVAQYDANVWLADLHVGALLDHARRLGLLEDALVIFTSDHGESLGEHGSWFEHGPLPYNTTARVPLLVFGAGVVAGRRVERPVELVDLYPTLRDLVAPKREVRGLEGHTLLPWLQAQAPRETVASHYRYSYSEAGERPHYYRSVQDGDWKLVQGFRRRGRQVGPGGWELYDLARDPAETANLASTRHDELRRMRAALLRWAHPGAERRSAQEGAEDADTEAALKALGYVN